MSHIPVLLDEALHYLDPKPGDFIIDGTLDGGGHAKEIVNKILPRGIFLGIDLDPDMIAKTKPIIESQMFSPTATAIFEQGNYADLPKILKKNKLPKANGLFLDLGFSSQQMEAGRGLSFGKDEPLDMRYDPGGEITAAEVVNSWTEKELGDLFLAYGEERYSRTIAREIIQSRKKKRIIRTAELTEIIERSVPKNYEQGRINPATRVFQALRIIVNDEIRNLETVLSIVHEIVEHQGRVVIISFHSLEDRMVKNKFRDLANDQGATLLTKKPIIASAPEMEKNPRSRSAKLRALRLN